MSLAKRLIPFAMFKLDIEYLMKSFDVIKKEILIFAVHF
jgi:hypothetical protein